MNMIHCLLLSKHVAPQITLLLSLLSFHCSLLPLQASAHLICSPSLPFVPRSFISPPPFSTFYLDILGVKTNPQSPMYTQLGVITKGTIIEVNVSDLGLVTPTGKVVWGILLTPYFFCSFLSSSLCFFDVIRFFPLLSYHYRQPAPIKCLLVFFR